MEAKSSLKKPHGVSSSMRIKPLTGLQHHHTQNEADIPEDEVRVNAMSFVMDEDYEKDAKK